MNTYQTQIGTPQAKLSNTYQTPSSRNAASTVQYQTFTTTSAIPQYQYMTITQQAPTAATTVVSSNVAALQQSGVRYSQQLVSTLPQTQQQTGIVGQPLTISSYQINNPNINSVSSPRIQPPTTIVQAASPSNNSELAQSIVNKYKSIQQSQQIIQQIKQKQSGNGEMRQSNTPNNLNSLTQTPKPEFVSSPKVNYESITTKVAPTIDLGPHSPTYAHPQSPIQARFFQTESSTKNSVVNNQQNILSYQPYRDSSRNASNYVPNIVQTIPENGATLNAYKSNGNLNQSFNQLNTSKFNSISMIPDKVSDKLIDEFQKLTESNLKFFMQNKQKWKEVEESLKHENEDLKIKISMLHESYSQINKSMFGAVGGTKPDISFSLQKDLDIATTYEQKVLMVQKELERSHLELEEYRKKNHEAQKKNDELNHTCTKLNEQLNAVVQKTIEGRIVDENQIDQVRQQYERKLNEEKQQYSNNIQNMKDQISVLETSLIQEKATTQKLQTDILNLTHDQINVGSNTYSANNNQVDSIKNQYENIISTQRQQFNQELLAVNQKIFELENNLTDEKVNNKKLQSEIQNLSTLVAEQSRIYEPITSAGTNADEIKRQHEEMLQNLKKQHQEEINRIGSQIAVLEYQLVNEKTTNQKLQHDIQNISISQINIDSSKQTENSTQEKEIQLEQLKKQFEETVLNQKLAYEQEIQKIAKQVEALEQSLIEEKSYNKKLEFEFQNVSVQYGNKDEEMLNLKKQVEELHNQNLKINQQNMELTQTQLAMAQIANENNANEQLLSEIQNLKYLNETLNLKNDELVQNKEKEIQEKVEEYRLIIQKMEQESFSVIQHVEDRGEKEVRNQANNMDSILYENQIEELNETIRQLQQQLEVQHVPNTNKQLTESPEVVRIYKKEENLINIQENFVNKEDEEESSSQQQKDVEQEIVSLKEEIVKQREEIDQLKDKLGQEYNTNEDLRQNLTIKINESEELDLKYKKQISEIESKLFLHAKDIAEKKQVIEDLEKSKKALAEQVFSYEEKEHKLHQQVAEAKDQLNKVQTETKFQIQETEKRHSTSTSQILNENDMKISMLKSEIQQTQSEFQLKLQQSEQQYTSQINQLTTQINTLNAQIQEKTDLIEEKEKKIEEQIQVAKKFEERVAEMVKEREDLLKHDKDIELQSKQLKEIMEKEYKHQLDVQISQVKKLESELESSKQKQQNSVDLLNEQIKKYQELEVQLNENKEKQQQQELEWNNQKKEIEDQNNQAQFELKNQLSELEKTITRQTHEEHQIKNDLEKYQNQLAQIAGQLGQKETQLNLFKKENSALSTKIQQIDEENNAEKQEITQKLEKLEAQHTELQQKYEKQVKQYERVKKEKEENDLLADEEINKLKLNYEALLESEKGAKEDVKKEFITKVDELKIQVARHDTKTRQIEDKHVKQVKSLEKEVEELKQLNNRKIESMKTIQETCNKLKEEKNEIEAQQKKKEQKYADELKEKNEEIETLTQQKKKFNDLSNELQEKLISEQKRVEELNQVQEKLTKELQQSEEKKISIEKEWIQKNEQTISEYERKISEKDSEFEKILSSKQGDSSQQIQELSSKILKQEKEFREKENTLNNKINTLQSSVKNQEEKLKSLEEENQKISTQFSEKIAVLNKEIDSHKQSIKENQNQIEAFEKEIKEKNQIIKSLESDKTDLEEKNTKQEEKIVLISTQLEQTKVAKKEAEDRLQRKLKEKEAEQSIITQDYNQKISVYKQTIDHLQNNSRQGEINFSQDLKFSQISKITDNLSDNNSHDEQADKLSGKELSSRLMGGVAALSQSRASVSSIRSKEETRSMYKKLSQMSMATAAMMSVKRDYVSLKELAKSIDDHDVNNTSNQDEIDPRLTKSEIQHK